MADNSHNPASGPAVELRCRDGRCATLVPADAEICDECAGVDLEPLGQGEAWLVGIAGDRRAGFELQADRASSIGRSSPGDPAPDVDLARFPGSSSVHRRHATIERRGEGWQITHAGRNPLLIQRREGALPVQPGGSAPLSPGDWLLMGTVRLQFFVRAVAAARRG